LIRELGSTLTPLDMLRELCKDPFFFESSVNGGRVLRPDCHINRQHLCFQASVIYIATHQMNRELKEAVVVET
jgi:hypothetical protein